ncbi:ras-related protein Rac1, partial [Biomphalaria pfeifferi]
TTSMGGKSYVISLFDTAGQEEYIHLRALSYVNSDVFLLCYSVATPESLRDAQDKWIPEIRKYCPNTPVILVGTQIDLRDEAQPTKPQRNTAKGPPVFISTKDGVHAATKMNLDTYVECSSLTEAGISRLREAAIESGLRKVDSEDTGCKCSCVIL